MIPHQDVVDLSDFIIFSSNWDSPGDFEDGDATGDGYVDFSDFLELSRHFGDIIIDEPSDAERVDDGLPGNRVNIYVVDGATDGDESLSFSNVDHANVYFYDHLHADVTYGEHINSDVGYGSEFGVVNIIGCTNLDLVCPNIANTHAYEPIVLLARQSSCALNIFKSSNINVIDPDLKGDGKSVFVAADSTGITVDGGVIEGRYFELNLGASDVNVTNTHLIQTFPDDSHAAINVTASYDDSNGGEAERNGIINIIDVYFEMNDGRSIVSGSTDDFSFMTTVNLVRPRIDLRGPITEGTYGLAGYHDRWHGFSVHRTGGEVGATIATMSPISSVIVDFVSAQATLSEAPMRGFGKFNSYQSPNSIGFIPVPPTGSVVGSDELNGHVINPNSP